MAKTNINIVWEEIKKFKARWLGGASDFGCKGKLEEIIPEKAMLLVQSGNKYLRQLVIERTEDKVVSVGICELEPSQLYRQPYKVCKAGRGFILRMLGDEEGQCLVDKNSEEYKKYYEILRGIN